MKKGRKNGLDFPLGRYQVIFWVILVWQILITNIFIIPTLNFPFNVIPT